MKKYFKIYLFDISKCFLSLIMVLCFFSSDAQEERKYIREGNKFYNEKKYSEAEQSYHKALEKNAKSSEAIFNKADALYSQKKYEEAAGQFESIAKSSSDPSLKQKAYHNLGNSLLQKNKLEESIKAYKEALKLNPKDEDTRYNLSYALKKLQQQQQQKDKNDKNKDNKDKDKDQKDKEKKDQDKKDKDDKKNEDKGEQDKKDQKDQQKQQKPNPEQVSKEDAKRMLDALNQDEKAIKEKLRKKQGKAVKMQIEKDW